VLQIYTKQFLAQLIEKSNFRWLATKPNNNIPLCEQLKFIIINILFIPVTSIIMIIIMTTLCHGHKNDSGVQYVQLLVWEMSSSYGYGVKA